MRPLLLAIYLVFLSTSSAYVGVDAFPVPDGAQTIDDVRLGKFDRERMVGFEAVILEVTRDEHERPIARVALQGVDHPVWCVFTIQAPSIKKATRFRLLGFMHTGESMKTLGMPIGNYAIDPSDPIILTVAYLDLTHRKAAFQPGAEKDWEDWSSGVFPVSRKKKA